MKKENRYSEPMISVVIPAYREGKVISATIQSIKGVISKLSSEWEIIIVDDGSDDKTFETAMTSRNADNRIKVIRFSRNFGKEAALLSGFQKSQGDVVISIDADLQHPPELITEMIHQWRQGVDIVHAVKRSRSSSGVLSLIGGKVFNYLFGKLSGMDLANASDYKLLTKEVVQHYCLLPERCRFFRGISTILGFTQGKILFDVQERAAGETTWSFFGLSKLAILGITSFSYIPLHLCTILGIVTFLICCILGFHTLYSKLFGFAVSGFATLEISILFLSSVIMLCLGIIGEYLSRIYEEIKQRPMFIIENEAGFDRQKGNR